MLNLPNKQITISSALQPTVITIYIHTHMYIYSFDINLKWTLSKLS